MADEPLPLETLLPDPARLPSLPGAVAQLNDILDDPDCSLLDVARIVESDPVIALKILAIVNSPVYGLRQEVTSIEHAVTLLGAMAIKQLVMTAAVIQTLKREETRLLRHSLACAIAMQALAESRTGLTLIEPNEAFLFGLVHDVGKLVLSEFLSDYRDNALAESRVHRSPLWQAERATMGADHADIGAYLGESWQLPAKLVDAIRGHHRLDACLRAETRALAAMVGVADFMCHAAGITAEQQAFAVPDPGIWAAAEVESADVPAILDRFFAGLGAVEDILMAAV